MKGSIVYEEIASSQAVPRVFRPEKRTSPPGDALAPADAGGTAMQWIAERFFTNGQEWIDAASGNAVSLHLFHS
jgi:hypothetical protein